MISKSEEEIIATWKNKDFDNPLVSVRCTAYNHGGYVGQCLDGILSQVTDFPFEIIIHDDASTDDTADIIREYEKKYPNIIHAIYQKENQHSKGVKINGFIDPQMRGKYVAMCECDDYWIDNKKLQKQIDFLLNNKEYGMCYTSFNIYYQKNDKFEYDLFKTRPDIYKGEYDLKKWILETPYVAPMTWVVKADLWNSHEPIGSSDATFVRFARYLAVTKVKCMRDDITAVYRVLEESASHSKSISKMYKRYEDIYFIQMTLADKYGLSEKFKYEISNKFYNAYYKIICVYGKKEDRQNSRKYCKGIKYLLFYYMTNFEFVRNKYKQMHTKKYA